MSDTVIRVENLGKKYIIGHQQKERYTSLREVLSNGAKSLSRKLLTPDKHISNPAFEDFWALKDLSFEIKQGDRVGIIGRNGAGKSTLLKILSRITEPTCGCITIKGRVATLLEVGTGFHPELTGRENIYLNGAILGMSRFEIQKKFDEIVAFAEVEKFLDTPVKRYSSGMYVRLAFAVAAHLEPEVLIVDEVLAVGDTQFQKKCLGKMKEVGQEGRTVLFVSHTMSAITSLCTSGILLKDGQVVYSGTAIDTVNKYLNIGENNKEKKLEWIAPNKHYPLSDILRVNRYCIIDEDGQIPENTLCRSKNYNVVIEVELLQNDSRIIFELLYYSNDDQILFYTDIHDNGGVNFSKMSLGKLRFSVPVPVELLNNRTYKIELISVIHQVAWILPPDNASRLKFEFIRDIDLNPNHYETTFGELAPLLKWDVSVVE